MPSNILTADTSFPRLTDQQSSDEKITIVTNYLYMLLEQLRYTLGNLGAENFNEAELDTIANIITEPVYIQLKDAEKNISALYVTAESLTSRMSNAEGNVSVLQQTATSLTSRIATTEGNISTLQQTATSLTSRISTTEGNVSTLQQTATSLTSRISTAEGNISSLQQTSKSISLTVASLEEGQAQMLMMDSKGVYIVDGEGNAVTISGGQIDADTLNVNAANVSGTLTADELYLNGLLAVKYGSSIYGYLGASTASTALGKGVAVCDSTCSNGFLAMTTGARMQYGDTSNQVYVIDGSVGITADGVYYYFYPYGLYPSDTVTLGTSSRTWGQIYSTNSVISTSDREKKNSIVYDVDERYDVLWDLLKPCTGKFNDGTSNRTHWFLISQDVETAIFEAGLTDKDFAAFIKSPKRDDEGNVIDGYDYAMRYEELIPLGIRQIQKQKQELNAMKEEMDALKKQLKELMEWKAASAA